MKRYIAILLYIIVPWLTKAQGTVWFKTSEAMVNVSGTVTDAESGERIKDAVISMNTSNAATDSCGQYSMSVPVGEHEVGVSALGYKGDRHIVSIANDTTINFRMEEYKDHKQILFRCRLPRRLEFELKMFNNLGIINRGGIEPHTIIGGEARYNLHSSAFAIGMNYSYSLPFVMDWEVGPDTTAGEVMTFGYWTVQAVTDYNFYRWWIKTVPFIGIGIGGGKSSSTTYEGPDPAYPDPEQFIPLLKRKETPIATCSLRAGIEINGNIRLNFEHHINSDGSRGTYLGINFVFEFLPRS
jgi:hypothetical protein